MVGGTKGEEREKEWEGGGGGEETRTLACLRDVWSRELGPTDRPPRSLLRPASCDAPNPGPEHEAGRFDPEVFVGGRERVVADEPERRPPRPVVGVGVGAPRR